MYTVEAIDLEKKSVIIAKDLDLYSIAIAKSSGAQLSGKYATICIVDQSTGETILEISGFDR